MFKVNSPPPPPEKPVAGKPKPQYWSHYLQSKVARAKERLEAELKMPTAEAEGGAATTADLEHLDEGDAKIEIGEVSADEAQAKHDANRHYRHPVSLVQCLCKLPKRPRKNSHVGGRVHGDLFARVEYRRRARQDLGHASRKDHVPCCQEQRWEQSVVASWSLRIEAGSR